MILAGVNIEKWFRVVAYLCLRGVILTAVWYGQLGGVVKPVSDPFPSVIELV